MALRQKLIISAFLMAGIGLFVAAGLIGNSGDDDFSVTQNDAVDALIPARGDEVLQQQQVGIDLAAGYRLVSLVISADARCEIPIDVTAHVRFVEGLQQYFYSPRDGLPVAALSADFNCAIAVFEEIAQPGATEQIEWAFTVS